MANKHSLSNQPSANIKQRYDIVSYQLGIEIGNERRAVNAQVKLRDEQEALEGAYNIAKTREDEAAARKARNEKNQADAKAAKEAEAAKATEEAPKDAKAS